MAKILGVPKVIKMDYQCWFGRFGHPDDRCKEHGTWGWTKAAADKAGASKNSVLRLARWCLTHRHPDDQLLDEEGNVKEKGLGARQQQEGEAKQRARKDGDLSS